MSGPLVSVIIPVFNGEAVLREAIESVLSQDFPSEIIIVDDGSIDRSFEVAKHFAAMYPGRILIAYQANGGQGLARNTGLRLAQAAYCAFLDADDSYAQEFLPATFTQLQGDDRLVAAVTRIELVDLHRPVENWHLEMIEASMPCNLLAKTEAARIVGYPTGREFRGECGGEDCEFRRLLHRQGPAVLISQKLYRHRVRPGGHLDLFLDRTRLVNGRVQFSRLTVEEADGSLQRASKRFEQSVDWRLCQKETQTLMILVKALDAIWPILPKSRSYDGVNMISCIVNWISRFWPVRGPVVIVHDLLSADPTAYTSISVQSPQVSATSSENPPDAFGAKSRGTEKTTEIFERSLVTTEDLDIRNACAVVLNLEKISKEECREFLLKLKLMRQGSLAVLRNSEFGKLLSTDLVPEGTMEKVASCRDLDIYVRLGNGVTLS